MTIILGSAAVSSVQAAGVASGVLMRMTALWRAQKARRSGVHDASLWGVDLDCTIFFERSELDRIKKMEMRITL